MKYEARHIVVREGVEHVRHRPAMYVGSVDVRGLHHLVEEVVDNCVDEAFAGRANRVDATIERDGSIRIVDDGGGISPEVLETVMTRLCAGGRFDRGPRTCGGLHGVGVVVVNALSAWLEVEVRRDGAVHRQRYSRGVATTPVEVVGRVDLADRGTSVHFLPDERIFTTVDLSAGTIADRLRELAWLVPGLTTTLHDRRSGRRESFGPERDLGAFANHLAESPALGVPLVCRRTVELPDHGPVHVALAVQYGESAEERVVSFANFTRTHQGTHMTGFHDGLARGWAYLRGRLRDPRIDGRRHRRGLAGVVPVMLCEPQFEGSTRTNLGNEFVRGLVCEVTEATVVDWIHRHPGEARRLHAL